MKNGCCVDGDCTDGTCMDLPAEKKCGDCVHSSRCSAMFGGNQENDHCQFFPRRFQALAHGLERDYEKLLQESEQWRTDAIRWREDRDELRAQVSELALKLNAADLAGQQSEGVIFELRERVADLMHALSDIAQSWDHEHASKGSVGAHEEHDARQCRRCIAVRALEASEMSTKCPHCGGYDDGECPPGCASYGGETEGGA